MCVYSRVCACMQRINYEFNSPRPLDVYGKGVEWGRRGWQGDGGHAGKWQSQQMCNGHNFLNAQTRGQPAAKWPGPFPIYLNPFSGPPLSPYRPHCLPQVAAMSSLPLPLFRNFSLEISRYAVDCSI